MGTYTTLNAYDGESRIPDFSGLNQRGNTIGAAPIYAVNAYGMDTKGGTLQPFAAAEVVSGTLLPAKIETLMHLHRRWPNQSTTPDDIIVAAASGSIYVRKEAADGEDWEDWSFVKGGFKSNVWSCVSYEVNTDINPTTGEAYKYGKDVLILSNSYDGAYILKEDSTAKSGFVLTQIVLTTDTDGVAYKPGILERSDERVWGTGFLTEPDQLMYSRPYDPTNWTGAQYLDDGSLEQDADVGGYILQPSWDGDSFTAIKRFGSYLLAFKKDTIWQISGTNPGEYSMKEQYGGGGRYPNTICVDSEYAYMLGDEGVEYYNGSTTQAFNQGYCADIWASMNRDAMDQSCAVIFKNRYYLSIPTGDSTVNNCVVIYDMTDGTWLVRRDLKVESWMATSDRLYFTTSDSPYSLCRYHEDSWQTGKAAPAETEWLTPWIDLNYKHYSKGPFTVFISPEVQNKPADISITLETEGRNRKKTIRVHPLLEWEQNLGHGLRQRSIGFQLHGMRFRLRISTDGTSTAPWRINGGILTMMDVQKET